jgi:hypothetical protein
MPRRRLLLGAGALALLGLVALWYTLRPPPPESVPRADYERVQVGMSLAEVRTILGGPEFVTCIPEGHADPLKWGVPDPQEHWPPPGTTWAKLWKRNQKWIDWVEVAVNDSGIVTGARTLPKDAKPPRPSHLTVWDRLRRRLPW